MSLKLMKNIGGAVLNSQDILYALGYTAKTSKSEDDKTAAIEIVFLENGTPLYLFYANEGDRDKDLERLQS